MTPPAPARRRSGGSATAAVAVVDAVLLVAVLATAPISYVWLNGSRPSAISTAVPAASPPASPTLVPSATPTPSPEPSATAALVYGDGTWSATAALPLPLWGSGAVTLRDGRVLVVGGSSGPDTTSAVATTEIYDPGTQRWTIGSPMLEARAQPMVALLPDGSVLVAGGSRKGKPLASAERYFPDSEAWQPAGALSAPRIYAAVAVLLDGRVLLAGGGSASLQTAATTGRVDIYDPESGRWTTASPLHFARAEATATLLPGGDVLVAGGASVYSGNRGVVTAAAEIYDPTEDAWRIVASMSVARYHHFAAPLPDGRVLVGGGWAYTTNRDPSLATTEIYDPAANTWTRAASMASGRARGIAVVLPGGRILVVGGVDPAYKPKAGAEIYDPARGAWQAAGQLGTAVHGPAVALLRDGRVLAAGGAVDPSGSHATDAAAIYSPLPPD
jgi:N-acetylneuraminic acid mutarotase